MSKYNNRICSFGTEIANLGGQKIIRKIIKNESNLLKWKSQKLIYWRHYYIHLFTLLFVCVCASMFMYFLSLLIFIFFIFLIEQMIFLLKFFQLLTLFHHTSDLLHNKRWMWFDSWFNVSFFCCFFPWWKFYRRTYFCKDYSLWMLFYVFFFGVWRRISRQKKKKMMHHKSLTWKWDVRKRMMMCVCMWVYSFFFLFYWNLIINHFILFNTQWKLFIGVSLMVIILKLPYRRYIIYIFTMITKLCCSVVRLST